MAKNFIQPGRTLPVAAPYNVVSGAGLLVGALFGIAQFAALLGETVEMDTEGVWSIGKVSAQAWAVGDLIYWDNVAKLATTVAAGNQLIGAATEVAANPTDVGSVKLNGSPIIPIAGAADTASAVVTAAAANVSEIAITVKDGAGNAVAKVHNIDVWLSDDADGQGLTGTTASGTVQAKAASGTVLDAMVAKKALRAQTLKTGVFTLEITDTAKTAFKVCASIAGRTVVLATLAAASYGA